ncbi:hypothetical protein D3C81_1217290 [compost metagenome]
MRDVGLHARDRLHQPLAARRVLVQRRRQPCLEAARADAQAGQRRAQLMCDGGQRRGHAAPLLLDQQLAVKLDHHQHRDHEADDRQLQQHRFPRDPAHGIAGQHEQRHRRRRAGQQRDGGERRIEVVEDHHGDDDRLGPGHRPAVLQVQEDEGERHAHGDRKQRIGRQPALVRERAGKQQRHEQRGAGQPQPQVLVGLREYVGPDQVVERVPDHPQRAHHLDPPQADDALLVEQDGPRRGIEHRLPGPAAKAGKTGAALAAA